MEVLDAAAELPEDSILLLRDFHQFFDEPNPVLIRRLKDQVRESRTTGKTLVVLGCRLNLPAGTGTRVHRNRFRPAGVRRAERGA